MENERLIELVRTHPVLYDHTHPKYSDNQYKEKTWKEIGRDLNNSSISCKARWNNIRDNYRKYKKKMSRHNGLLRSYKYGEQLQFLDDFFHDRKSVLRHKGGGGGGGGGGDDGGCGDDEVESVEVTYSDTIDNVSMYEAKHEFQMEDCDGSISPSNSASIQTITMLPKYKVRGQSALASLDYLADESPPPPPSNNETPQERAVDAFLAGIAPTLKSLSAYNLNLAKGEIFGIVQKYEMKMILDHKGGSGDDDNFIAHSASLDNTESEDGAVVHDPLT